MSKRADHMAALFKEVQRVFTPLTVGFDTFFEGASTMLHNVTGYPPYNIIRKDGETVIEVALAGLCSQDLKVYVEHRILHIQYEKERDKTAEEKDVTEKDFLHQGIASRSFDLTIHIAQGVQVHSAKMKDGLLQVSLLKIPPVEPEKSFVPIVAE